MKRVMLVLVVFAVAAVLLDGFLLGGFGTPQWTGIPDRCGGTVDAPTCPLPSVSP